MTASPSQLDINPRLDRLTDYPFQRLAALLSDLPTPPAPILMSIGEPQHAPPAFVAEILGREAAGWGRYPPMAGTSGFRAAAAAWAERRFDLAPGRLDPDRHVLPLAGTREGLFQIAQLVLDQSQRAIKDLVLLPNPFYQVYAGAALMAGGEPVFVSAEGAGGLPDYESLPAELLDRVALAYLCNPANPQGTVASSAALTRLIALARRHDFVIAADECYSEIYQRDPPPGCLTVAGDDFDRVLVFHSLSKRSSAPGLRSGFVAGDARLIAAFGRFRAYGGAAVPLPILAASTALWQDEAHVAESRDGYRAKFAAADRCFRGHPGYARPEGGFFLWLRVGDGEAATRALWKEAGIKVLPGAYLARAEAGGHNPGAAFIRVALVQDLATTQAALAVMASVLAAPQHRNCPE